MNRTTQHSGDISTCAEQQFRLEAMNVPSKGSKILVLKWPWLQLILERRKTMEIRGLALQRGRYFLGYKKMIYGWAEFGDAQRIVNLQQWKQLRSRHLVQRRDLPYKKTYGLPILRVKCYSKPVPYVHPRGAVGIVRMS